MAEHDGVNFAVAEAPTPTTVLATEKWGGRVKVICEKVTLTATGTVNDLLNVGKLPKGAIPLGGFLRYDGNATSTLVIGYTADTDALGTATALATTRTQMLYPSKEQCNTPLTQDKDIQVKVKTRNMVTGNILMLQYLYAKD
jgi:hypothetical protein